MKLSGHTYDNALFDSLLEGLKDDVVLKKQAKKKEPEVSGMDVFSSQTQVGFDEVLNEELEFIAKELEFAADKARIAVTAEDLVKFATQVRADGLRGKKLERAAQKYCNILNRAVAAPTGTTKLSDSLINQLSAHAVIPASYPSDEQNNSATGKFMGCSKNPNTIWDSEALTRFASVKHGDEQIKASKEAEKQHRLDMKQAQWQELQDKHSEPEQIHDGIIRSGQAAPPVDNQNLPVNSMSMFSNQRDFENIPEKTLGERVAEIAKKRAEKRAESKGDWNKVEPAKTTNTRSWIDSVFDGLAAS